MPKIPDWLVPGAWVAVVEEGPFIFTVLKVSERGVLLNSGWWEPVRKCMFVPEEYAKYNELPLEYWDELDEHPEWDARNF